MPKTLFIMFYFPPFTRVGGRRWAKHIKYFQKQNEDFMVLAGDFMGYSPWTIDIESYRYKIKRIPVTVFYPYFKKKLPRGFLSKLRWKLSYYSNKRAEQKYNGNFWDDSRTHEDKFFQKAKEIILQEHISHVCMSVGPFSYARILPKLKNEFKKLRITLDYRDYWHDGLHTTSKQKREQELKWQNEVLESVDLVLAPNTEMCNSFKINFHKNVYLLPHCIDEDFQNVLFTSKRKSRTDFVFLYGGSLYSEMEKYIAQMIDFLKEIELHGRTVELKIRTMQPGYLAQFQKSGLNIEVKDLVPVNEYIQLASESDIILLFRPDWSPNGFSSKFYEAVALRKPILYFGPNGDVNDFIKSKQLGFSINDYSIKDLAKYIIENETSEKIPDRSYSLNEHTFEFQTKKLIEFWDKFYEIEN